jgi:hypothetical protein
MAETQCDSSSDSESSDVLEGTPVKEDNGNITLLSGLLASKKTQRHTSIHSTARYTGNGSKSRTTEIEYHSQKEDRKLGILRSSRSLSASDDEGAVTDETEGSVVSDSPELLKAVLTKGNGKKKKFIIYSSDSDASDTPEKSMTAGKYRDSKYVESSDSETSSVSEESTSASDSTSPVTMRDKNAAVGTELSKAESSNADGRPVIQTSTSGKFTVDHKRFKSPIQNVVEVGDAMEKTVEDDDNDSSVKTKEVSSSSLLN